MEPDYKVLEEKLRFYEHILDHIDAWIYVNRVDGPVYYNKKIIDDIGKTPAEVIEYGMYEYQRDFYHPDDMHFFEDSVKYMNNPDTGKATTIYRQKDRSGKYVRALISVKATKRTPDGMIEEAVNCGIIISDTLDDNTHINNLIRENALLKSRLMISELTNRELQILRLIEQGLSTREIAEKEGISFHTVESHRKNLFRKLDAKNLADLVRIATECELNK